MEQTRAESLSKNFAMGAGLRRSFASFRTGFSLNRCKKKPSKTAGFDRYSSRPR